jgi:ribonuclease P protein component
MARPMPVRGRRSFEQLRVEGVTVRTRLLSIRALRVHDTTNELRVSYAIGRHVGPAVVRNRVRRRLRSLVAERHLPDGQYLVAAQKGAVNASYWGLADELDDVLLKLETRFVASFSQGRT